MKLEIMQRTLQAIAAMDLEVARKVMGIAETMAEQFPKQSMSKEIDDARLHRDSYTEEVVFSLNDGYVSVQTTIAPSMGARRLPAYIKPVKSLYAS